MVKILIFLFFFNLIFKVLSQGYSSSGNSGCYRGACSRYCLNKAPKNPLKCDNNQQVNKCYTSSICRKINGNCKIANQTELDRCLNTTRKK